MTTRDPNLDSNIRYDDPTQDDHRTSYEKMTLGAENFLDELRSLDPQLDDAIVRTSVEHRRLKDDDARAYRPDWEWKNAPIKEWDRTAHYRNGDIPPWMGEDPTKAAIYITESFHRSTTHLTEQESSQAGYHVAEILVTPINEQLNAVKGDENLKALMNYIETDTHGLTEHIKMDLAQALSHNDDEKVQYTMERIAQIQEDFNQLETLRGLEAIQGYKPQGPQDHPQPEDMSERQALIYQTEQDHAEQMLKHQASDILLHTSAPAPGQYNHNTGQNELVNTFVDHLWQTDPALVERISDKNFHENEFITTQRDLDITLIQTVANTQYSMQEKKQLYDTAALYIASEANYQCGRTLNLKDITWHEVQQVTTETDPTTGAEISKRESYMAPHWQDTGGRISDEDYREHTQDAWKQLDRLHHLMASDEWKSVATDGAAEIIEAEAKSLQESLEGKTHESLQTEDEPEQLDHTQADYPGDQAASDHLTNTFNEPSDEHNEDNTAHLRTRFADTPAEHTNASVPPTHRSEPVPTGSSEEHADSQQEDWETVHSPREIELMFVQNVMEGVNNFLNADLQDHEKRQVLAGIESATAQFRATIDANTA